MYKSYGTDLQNSKDDAEEGVGIIDNVRILDEEHRDYDDDYFSNGMDGETYPVFELTIRRPSGNTMTCHLRWPEEWGEDYRLAELFDYYGIEPLEYREIVDQLIPIELNKGDYWHNRLDFDMEWWIDFGEIREVNASDDDSDGRK